MKLIQHIFFFVPLASISILLLPTAVSSFAPSSSSSLLRPQSSSAIRLHKKKQPTTSAGNLNKKIQQHRIIPICHDARAMASATELQAFSHVVTSFAKERLFASPTARIISVIAAATLLVRQYQRILWPRSSPDHAFLKEYPLPEGSFGCPFVGTTSLFAGDKKNGPGAFWRKMATKSNYSRIFKFFALGRPFVGVAGSQNLKAVLSSEFRRPGVFRRSSAFGRIKKIRGTENLINCDDKKSHAFQRHLLGATMTRDALIPALPRLEVAASNQIDKLLEASSNNRATKMEDICTDYTFDTAWRQILGLKLDEAEALKFKQAIIDWLGGFRSIRAMILPGSPSEKARHYMDTLLLQRMKELERDGSDGSTFSSMLFASVEDEGGVHRKLTTQQVLDNAVGLVFAGTETSASTLTTAMLLLGLHPDVWDKLVKEQHALCSKYGKQTSLTTEQLDSCSYLDAVIKETMRIKPISIGLMRVAKDTLVIDGKQIPKGYSIMSSITLTHAMDPVTRKEDGSHMDVRLGFKPERWLDESTCPSGEYFPFGYGPHFCLGNDLAMMGMKVFLALMARRVDFNLVNDFESSGWKEQSLIPKPADGCLVTARPRQIGNISMMPDETKSTAL